VSAASRRDLVIGVLLLAAAIAVPLLFTTRYIVTQATLFFIWAIVVTQWNLVLGVGGIFSLAQMALFACGAYTAAILGATTCRSRSGSACRSPASSPCS
jgi:branched-chain amino acid transport system permease protein